MIYVRRNSALIPPDVLTEAMTAQSELERLPPAARAEFIKSKAEVWRAFKSYLTAMSYGKCWYSENPADQSFMDVDHFRPKLEAKRSTSLTDPGYEWLAFSWENFRLSAQRSNRLSTNEDTGVVEGKASWFPLLDGSPKATWDQRCEDREMPVLLDPTKKDDVRLIDVLDDGMMGPSRFCFGSSKKRVETSITLFGLNLPALKAARLRIMREVQLVAQILLDSMTAAQASDAFADAAQLQRMRDGLEEKTHPQQPYAAAARAQLRRMGLGDLCAQPEAIL